MDAETGDDAAASAVPRDVDAAILRGEEPPSARRPLDRATIVLAGLAFIDEHGLAGLTMRRLGTRLGVEAMALYHHVPGKESLLDDVVDVMVDEVRADDEVVETPTHGWQDFLQRLAHGVRRVALTHPRAFPLIASRPPEAPWLRPPLRNVEWVEVFLRGLTGEGFSDDGAVAAYRAFTSFLLGHLLLEVAVLGGELGPLDVLEDPPAGRSLDDLPHLRRMADALAEDHSAAEFEESLENLLERIALIHREDERSD